MCYNSKLHLKGKSEIEITIKCYDLRENRKSPYTSLGIMINSLSEIRHQGLTNDINCCHVDTQSLPVCKVAQSEWVCTCRQNMKSRCLSADNLDAPLRSDKAETPSS